MINTILIHGDDVQKSYDRKNKLILAAKKRSWDIVNIEKSIGSFKKAVTNPVLFASDRLIVVDKFSDLSEKDLKFLMDYEKKVDATLLIYNEGTLSAAKIKSLPRSSKIEIYELPILLWKYLDSIYPGNSEYCLNLFNAVVKNSPPEFVFSLMAKLFRDLYWVTMPDTKLTYQPWRKAKLMSQAKKYHEGQIEKMIDELAKIDIKVKTSRTNLKESIDFFLVKHLE